MLNDNEKTDVIEQDPPEDQERPLKPYVKPDLEELGDMRAITLGGSPGINDSGAGDPFFPP